MTHLAERLEALIEEGLTFAQVTAAFAARQGPELLAYRDAVSSKDGELEFDDDAIVSKGDDAGAYVMGWVWVPDRAVVR